MESLDDALFIVFLSMVLTPLLYALVGLGLALWAFFRPSPASSIAAFVAAVPLTAGTLLLLALGMNLGPEENDRWLYPFSFGGSALLLALTVLGVVASHRAARHAGTRSPLTHPLGWAALALSVGGALAFIMVSSD